MPVLLKENRTATGLLNHLEIFNGICNCNLLCKIHRWINIVAYVYNFNIICIVIINWHSGQSILRFNKGEIVIIRDTKRSNQYPGIFFTDTVVKGKSVVLSLLKQRSLSAIKLIIFVVS